MYRKPDAGDPHVRFDERDLETELKKATAPDLDLHREPVTVVGALASVNAGEWIAAQGNWVQDKEHGLQFKATFLKCSPPTSREGIEKYLASGLIKGFGPVYAKKLVEKFGEEIFAVIDHYSVQLEEVDGIGPGCRQKSKLHGPSRRRSATS